ncbi:3'-5' exonuclease [Patescibacteria group bacterium]|nr:3'-5' exonuclease [Patescibacteria group bacterium]
MFSKTITCVLSCPYDRTKTEEIRKDAKDVRRIQFPRHLLIIDTETTGLLENTNSRIIQLAAVLLDKNSLKEIDTWESLVWTSADSWKKASKEALKIHGIQYKELQQAPDWNQVWEKFLSFFSMDQYDLYGQNIFGFDVPMIK